MNKNSKNTKSETSTIFSENFSQNSKPAHFNIVGHVFCELHTVKLSVIEVFPHDNMEMNRKYREIPFKKIDVPHKIIENSIYDYILFEIIRIADMLNCYGFKYTHNKKEPFVFYCVKDKGSKSYLYRVTLRNILRGELL